MKNYLITGHSDGTAAPSTNEEWGAFFETISAHVVDGGKPLGARAQVSAGKVSKDGSDDTTVGYYIIKADSLGDAIELVKGSPFADRPGCTVVVYETEQM
ncbi:MAG TPA: hypothetical protein VLG92_01190 [Candidatus Saccharimonadia bacterium]|nr:hypothetical protein [Candidatus Saccharimonadia bacterium]